MTILQALKEEEGRGTKSILPALKEQERFLVGDDATDQVLDDVSRFSVKDAYDSVGILSAHVNRGLLGILDIPQAGANAVIDLINYGTGASIPRGTLPIAEGLSAVTDPSRQTSNQALVKKMRPLGTALEFGAGSVIPLSWLNKMGMTKAITNPSLAVKLPSSAKTAAPTIIDTFANPNAIKAEVGLASASGLGAGIASYASDGDPMAELLGSVALPISIQAVSHIADNVTGLYQLGKQKFSEVERASTAADIILRHADDPQQAIKNLRASIDANKSGSLGQLAQDKGILGFEKLMASRSKGNFNTRLDANDRALSDELISLLDSVSADGAEDVARLYIKGRLDTAKRAVQLRLNEAKKRAQSALERAGTDLEGEDASKILSQQIDEAYDLAEVQHKALWAEVPDVEIDASGLFDEINDLAKANLTSKTAIAEGTEAFTKELKRIKDLQKKGGVSVQELIDLRSSLLSRLRNLRKTHDSNKFQKKFVSDVQGALLDRIDNAPSVGREYRTAAEYTKFIDDVFRGTSFDSSDDMSQVLSGKVFRSGLAGAQTADELLKVQGINSGVEDAIGDVIRADFAKTAVFDGVVDAKKAKQFLKKNAEFLSRYKSVRAELEEAASTQKLTDKVLRHQARSNSHIDKSVANIFLEPDDPVRAIDSLVSGNIKSPRKAAETLYRMASKDKSGQAVKGLRRMAIDSLMEKITKDIAGETGFHQGFDKGYKKLLPALKVLFKDDPASLKRVDDVMSDVGVLLSRRSSKRPHDTVEQSIALVTIGKILGARVGAKIGTTPLISAGLGGKLMEKVLSTLPRDITANLVEEMLLDPARFEKALPSISAITNQGQAIRLLNAWLVNAGIKSYQIAQEQPADDGLIRLPSN